MELAHSTHLFGTNECTKKTVAVYVCAYRKCRPYVGVGAWVRQCKKSQGTVQMKDILSFRENHLLMKTKCQKGVIPKNHFSTKQQKDKKRGSHNCVVTKT